MSNGRTTSTRDGSGDQDEQLPGCGQYDFKNLGGRLKVPAGWKICAVALEKNLVLMFGNGNVRITQDDLGSTYDRVGAPISNYKP